MSKSNRSRGRLELLKEVHADVSGVTNQVFIRTGVNRGTLSPSVLLEENCKFSSDSEILYRFNRRTYAVGTLAECSPLRVRGKDDSAI